jgi:hypothetical protein
MNNGEEKTMATFAQERNESSSTVTVKSIGGVLGGVAGGIVFGIMMGVMGMLPMVAGLVGSSSALIGFGVHIVISIIIGIGFGFLFGEWSKTFGSASVWGLVYGAIWWVLGPLTLMPLMMGMGVQFASAFTTPRLMSLVGHLLFGLVAGLVYAWYVRRSA